MSCRAAKLLPWCDFKMINGAKSFESCSDWSFAVSACVFTHSAKTCTFSLTGDSKLSLSFSLESWGTPTTSLGPVKNRNDCPAARLLFAEELKVLMAASSRIGCTQVPWYEKSQKKRVYCLRLHQYLQLISLVSHDHWGRKKTTCNSSSSQLERAGNILQVWLCF